MRLYPYIFQNGVTILLLSFLMSCDTPKFRESNYESIPAAHLKTPLSFTEEDYTIEFPDNYQPDYAYRTMGISTIRDTSFLALYNYREAVIDIFNLGSGVLAKQCKVPAALLNNPSIQNEKSLISSIYLQSYDSIFLMTSFGLALINDKEEIIWQDNLNYNANYGLGDVVFRNPSYCPLQYDASKDELTVYGLCNKYSTYSNKFYDFPFDHTYKPSIRALAPLPVKYSELFKSAFYSATIYPARESNDKYHVYTFRVDPNIYVYDKESQNITVKGGQSRHQHEPIPYFSEKVSLNKNEELNYLKKIGSYGRLLYDPYRKLYYRFYKRGQELKNTDGTYRTANDKYESLMVFNEDFEILEEVDLDRYKYFSFLSIVTDQGLLISNKNIKNPEADTHELGFYLLKFNSKQHEKS